ncbi:hypothetical protein M2447_001831 [Ereboglobus sp. PH5-10]|uniref:hypothetical protein n=1 Tax=Ereboglobus sp. PH5-10 TaxID=2940629 RepID=UPI00240701AB|nr:hypothetical protein [Ereboglobus sp. PH5-10]MDF9827732.1 hypothetical protein [Ereboglobus sp. PH5-10]
MNRFISIAFYMFFILIVCGCGPTKTERDMAERLDKVEAMLTQTQIEMTAITKSLRATQDEALKARAAIIELEKNHRKATMISDFYTLKGEVFIVNRADESFQLGGVCLSVYSKKEFDDYIKRVRGEKEKTLRSLYVRLKSADDSHKKTLAEYDALQEDTNEKYPILKLVKQESWPQSLKDDYNKRKKRLDELGSPLGGVLERKKTEIKRIEKSIALVISGDFYYQNLPAPKITTQTNSNGSYKVVLKRNEQYVLVCNAKKWDEQLYWFVPILPLANEQNSAEILLNNNNIHKGEF